MFAHLVLIKLKPGVMRANPRVPAWEAKFAALEHQCAGIVRFESGWNTTDRPIAYDFGINMAFATRRSRCLRAASGAPGSRHQTARDRRLGHLRLRNCRVIARKLP